MKTLSKPMKTSSKLLIIGVVIFFMLLLIANMALKSYIVG